MLLRKLTAGMPEDLPLRTQRRTGTACLVTGMVMNSVAVAWGRLARGGVADSSDFLQGFILGVGITLILTGILLFFRSFRARGRRELI
jgi:hypothetical protein